MCVSRAVVGAFSPIGVEELGALLEKLSSWRIALTQYQMDFKMKSTNVFTSTVEINVRAQAAVAMVIQNYVKVF